MGKRYSTEAMNAAIKEAYDGINAGDGGPFGAVIINTKTGEIVGRGHNRVIKNNDPTCHGEMEAIRDACKNLGTFDLSGHDIYTTGEPCPMCLSAIMWANIDDMCYGCNKKDTDKIGFRDDIFYDKIQSGEPIGKEHEEFRRLSLKVYKQYKEMNPTMY